MRGENQAQIIYDLAVEEMNQRGRMPVGGANNLAGNGWDCSGQAMYLRKKFEEQGYKVAYAYSMNGTHVSCAIQIPPSNRIMYADSWIGQGDLQNSPSTGIENMDQINHTLRASSLDGPPIQIAANQENASTNVDTKIPPFSPEVFAQLASIRKQNYNSQDVSPPPAFIANVMNGNGPPKLETGIS